MLSHNRWTFAASLAIVAMMAEGLESLREGLPPRRAWFWLPAIVTAGFFGYCVIHTLIPPELTIPSRDGPIPLETFVRAGGTLHVGGTLQSITTVDDVHLAETSFIFYFAHCAC